MIKETVAILIPIYKKELNKNELISLKQCITVLKDHTFIFIAPNGLDITEYKKVCENKAIFYVEYFDGSYFADIDGYNKLMLSAHFYKNFMSYKFILIYQLDAFVFKDTLLYWCKQDYDYIGAPHLPHENLNGEMQFLKNYNKFLNIVSNVFHINHKLSNVGNGGFSLRKTKSCYRLLKVLRHKVDAWGTNNEDGFFKYWGNIFYPLFKLPTDETALEFSIEISPKESLEKLRGSMPFGCHAFEKYDWETWQPYVLNEDML